jgi:hypothetical protein
MNRKYILEPIFLAVALGISSDTAPQKTQPVRYVDAVADSIKLYPDGGFPVISRADVFLRGHDPVEFSGDRAFLPTKEMEGKPVVVAFKELNRYGKLQGVDIVLEPPSVDAETVRVQTRPGRYPLAQKE